MSYKRNLSLTNPNTFKSNFNKKSSSLELHRPGEVKLHPVIHAEHAGPGSYIGFLGSFAEE